MFSMLFSDLSLMLYSPKEQVKEIPKRPTRYCNQNRMNIFRYFELKHELAAVCFSARNSIRSTYFLYGLFYFLMTETRCCTITDNYIAVLCFRLFSRSRLRNIYSITILYTIDRRSNHSLAYCFSKRFGWLV